MQDYGTQGADVMHKWVNNVKVILKKQGVRVFTELIWVKIGTSGGLLCTHLKNS
jgi:hypothetical protein